MMTSGQNGKYIPEQAYKMVELYGTEFFSDVLSRKKTCELFVRVPESLQTDKYIQIFEQQ